ncbi:microfibril-associated glycoprotein 4-like [Littorina saxatilis]|uniref:microfibril-associated glycoprotein 4-like n=1 Tax=Littorina saxatilis TaxID=31220 RepID=UPI0038B54E0A
MTSIRFRMIGVALFVVALSALEAYQWNGGPEDKAKIKACAGGSVSFAWSFVMGHGDTLLDRDWYFQAPGKDKATSIARYDGKDLFTTDQFRRAGFLPNAGLSLPFIKPQDSGKYSVRVKIMQANVYICSFWRTVTLSLIANSCVDWLSLNPLNGLRTVCVSGEQVTVYCDQARGNGGWIVFQRRMDASVDFFRGWADYRNGFGNLEGNFWLGLDKLHRLTTSQKFELRVDLHLWNGTKGYATYSGFYVEDVSHNFALRFDRFTGGNAGDSLSYHRGQQFSTKDRDHDLAGLNCAQRHHGAWWYRACIYSNLNGDYKVSSSAPKDDGVGWATFVGMWNVSMRFSEMKIRPM